MLDTWHSDVGIDTPPFNLDFRQELYKISKKIAESNATFVSDTWHFDMGMVSWSIA